jgi:chromosome partitioning protein
VGKTTTAVNLGIGLVKEGKKVTLATILRKIISEQKLDPDEGILQHDEGVDILPGNIELSVMELTMANAMSRELIKNEFRFLI